MLAQGALEAAGFELGYSSWLNDRDPAGFLITVRGDVAAAQQAVDTAVGVARVVVESARYSRAELQELQDRLIDDHAALEAAGVDPSAWHADRDHVSLKYFALDRAAAEAGLAQRYGDMLKADWLGPSRMAAEPQTFGSWVCDGRTLSVFYPLHLNGEQPGTCRAIEHPDRVEVTLTVVAPQGFRTLIGGYRPSVATVELATPVGERHVIDMADQGERPRWTE